MADVETSADLRVEADIDLRREAHEKMERAGRHPQRAPGESQPHIAPRPSAQAVADQEPDALRRQNQAQLARGRRLGEQHEIPPQVASEPLQLLVGDVQG
jgi:hypothetical protein